ncbi:TPA: hypothetical protein N6791_000965 [Escherichia coli]|uniref:Uncharacterized protein n=1 Tax=Escherichia coli TaxID=562 RepID=A0A7T2MX74_ECOLX|nr:hypothetical protein [Escherichia coli]EHP6195627.1 hypothetical protein [Escherichia coli]EHX2562425.1 hypothetical protein [Escherichia coli]EIY8628903.1 hypothetical protein [Escherichia coli]EJC7762721.1 hypothetical protein [Escherichia coli]EJC8045005.1 hypothetical protein [Escherichia coli]
MIIKMLKMSARKRN